MPRARWGTSSCLPVPYPTPSTPNSFSRSSRSNEGSSWLRCGGVEAECRELRHSRSHSSKNDSWASDHGESIPSDREPNPFPSPDLTPVDPQMELVYVMPLEEFRSFALTGIFAAPGGRLQFFRYPDVQDSGEGNHRAYIDVHKCLADGIPMDLEQDAAEFNYGVTEPDRVYLP